MDRSKEIESCQNGIRNMISDLQRIRKEIAQLEYQERSVAFRLIESQSKLIAMYRDKGQSE